ncbi:TonB family protein [Marinobacter sp. C2H3]|uniref:TonB family protein n=1 Tax=Marinobacter sp. C2H3 TaxID=3119003 RepID=UPI00300E8B41
MTETAHSPGLPAPYRLILALSSAVAIHLVALSLWSYTPPEQAPQSRLTVALVSPPAAPSQPEPAHASTAVPARTTEPAKTQPPKAQPEQVHVPAPNATFTKDHSPAEAANAPQPALGSASQAPPAPSTRRAPRASDVNSAAEATQIAAEPAPESTASPAEAATPVNGAPDDLTRITHAPAEQDDYLVSLAAHLARQLKSLHAPAVEDLKAPRRMTVVLRLMENGTLTRAIVGESTGLPALDRAVYRAALAASPYPEPPAGHKSEGRFEIELVFSPKRL